MRGALSGIHITNLLGLVGFLVMWIGLVEGSKMVCALLKNARLVGWAIGPLGISTLFLYEPSALFIVLNALFPALVSGLVLYVGLFTAFPSPIAFPHRLLIEIPVIAFGVLITSLGGFIDALRDLRYPLWGEARILRSIQYLRASCASIHFTAFGRSYLRDQFDSSPTDLLQAF
ncbi:MAG TPA: hypothetical protein VFA41_19770 [Ktedonobacteraceae bacterium]|nr:hypothetical protein [Ktedonobacteraceae bacterium]